MKWPLMAYAILAFSINLDGIECVYDADNQPADVVDFGTALQMFDIALRNIMPCGYPPQNIPVLAPYTSSYYTFNSTNGSYKLAGNISHLAISGLNKFYFLDFTFNSITNRTSYDIIFTDVEFFGQYMIDFWAKLAGFPASMSGKGLLEMKVLDFRLVGDFILGPNPYNPKGLRISDFNLHFYIGDFVSNNWNYNWNIAANNFFNAWAQAFVLMWAQQIQVQLNMIYAQLLLPILNGFLDSVSMSQLINFFVEESMALTMASCTVT